jgi:hypothetical protein
MSRPKLEWLGTFPWDHIAAMAEALEASGYTVAIDQAGGFASAEGHGSHGRVWWAIEKTPGTWVASAFPDLLSQA